MNAQNQIGIGPSSFFSKVSNCCSGMAVAVKRGTENALACIPDSVKEKLQDRDCQVVALGLLGISGTLVSLLADRNNCLAAIECSATALCAVILRTLIDVYKKAKLEEQRQNQNNNEYNPVIDPDIGARDSLHFIASSQLKN